MGTGCYDGGSFGDGGNGLFEFVEGRAGRAVGVTAIVTVDGQVFETSELEIALEPEGTEVSLTAATTGRDTRHPAAVVHRDGRPVRPRQFDLERQVAALHVPASATNPRALPEVCTDGGPVGQIGTFDGWLCWVSQTYAAGSLIEEKAYQTFFFFAPEGTYMGVIEGTNVYVPPDYVHISATHNFGCVKSPEGATASASWIEGLASLAYSFSLGVYVFGASAFIDETYGGFATGIQYDVGASIGLGFGFLPGIVGMSINTDSAWLVGPLPVSGLDGECPMPATSASILDDEVRAAGGPPAAISARLSRYGGGTSTHRDVLRSVLAEEARPLMEFLASPTGHGPAYHVPAATNADLWDDFFAREADGLCDDCVDTSLHALLGDFAARVIAAGDDGEQIFAEGAWASARQLEITPQLTRQGDLMTTAALSVELGFEVAEDLAAEARGDTNRFVAAGVRSLDAEVGSFVDFGLSSAEIASLIDVDPTAVLGATVTVDMGPRLMGAELTMDAPELGAGFTPSRAEDYLVRFTVDLSTADGPLPSGADTWFVRPQARVVRVRPGAPSRVMLGATRSTIAGAPVTLMVEALDADYNYVESPLTVRFVDFAGETLGEAAGDGGFVSWQYVPAASKPEVTGGEAVTLEFGDGSTGPGWKVLGRGFSRDATIVVDGVELSPFDHVWAVSSAGSILIADAGLELQGSTHEIRVMNPHGLGSGVIRVDFE